MITNLGVGLVAQQDLEDWLREGDARTCSGTGPRPLPSADSLQGGGLGPAKAWGRLQPPRSGRGREGALVGWQLLLLDGAWTGQALGTPRALPCGCCSPCTGEERLHSESSDHREVRPGSLSSYSALPFPCTGGLEELEPHARRDGHSCPVRRSAGALSTLSPISFPSRGTKAQRRPACLGPPN